MDGAAYRHSPNKHFREKDHVAHVLFLSSIAFGAMLVLLWLSAFLVRLSHAQDPEAAQIPIDLTLALIPYDSDCSIEDVPSIHISGMQNDLTLSLSTEILWNTSYAIDKPGRDPTINYTVSNPEKFSNSTWYTRLYYQQGGNGSEVAKDVVAPILVQTYPCSNTGTDCQDKGRPPNATGQQPLFPSGPTLSDYEAPGWDCFAEGACYNAGYDIKGILLSTTGSELSNQTVVKGRQCLLADVTVSNITRDDTSDGNAVADLNGSINLTLWTAFGLTIALAWWR